MSLAKLFYLKETFRTHVRQWRQACFRQQSNASHIPPHNGRFALEVLEPRVLLSATPTEVVAPQPLEPAAVTVSQGNLPSLDVDLNGKADALTDGILIIRHLFGFSGSALTTGAVDPAGQRTDPTAIANYLESIRPSLDVDLDQQADALTDGILIIRNLFGFTGTTLTTGAIDPAGHRTDPGAITAFLDNLNPQRETVAPLMTAGLQQDTGLSVSDAITNTATITGTLVDINQIASFSAGFDATPVANFTNILSDLLPTGVFTLSTLRMNQLAGGTLADGTHTLHLRATDARGNLTTLDRTFTLDTQAPVNPTFDLAVTSDTGTVGDQQTTAAIVTLKGQTDPTTPLQLVGLGTSTLSNGTGTFQLPDLTLAVGANAFTLRASDVAGNHSDFTRTITRLAATPQADVVLTWNQTMLEAIRLDATPPPVASRGMAMVSLAMYDAINAIEGTPGYYVSLPAQPGSDPNAAAAQAAYRVLSYLYPGQQAFFDSQLASSLNAIPNGLNKTNGIALGQNIADAIIAIRATDGWNDFVDYVPGSQPGDWQETAPMYDVALLPQWADLTPFALTTPDQFRPAGPPALDSAAYAAALNEVKTLGSATGSTRTADQTEIARFWADGAGTATPPGHWEQIAQQIALQQGNSLSSNARLFAELNVALADAAITAWNTKYTHEFWRPITAIQQADLDGNALTTAETNWQPLLLTPPFPEYISGHSTFSGAAAEILTNIFGNNVAFSTTSLGLPGVTRSFTSFEQAAQEAGRSRIYGGIHFEFSNQDGLTAGKSLADFVLNKFTVTTDTQGPKILLDPTTTKAVTSTNLTLKGQVLDNLAGVAALQVKLDTGTFASVVVDATGHFSLPTTLLLDGTQDGAHTLTFQARDNQNNFSTLVVSFTLDTKAPIITLTSPADNATLTVNSRLTGIADATGSKLVELCYKFDNGTLVPVSFDPTTGSFDLPLDLSKLAVGAHTLSLRAQDQAGNVTTVTRGVTLTAPVPLTIIEMTPATGASDVGTTFRPQVFFSRPVNTTTLNANNFYATDTTGTKLAATIVPSQDGTFAWLFFANPMPGASTITLHVDGTTILAAGDGQALDADANGTPGGIFTSTFSTVSLVPLAGTTLSGKVLDPGPDLKTMTFDDLRAGADGVLHTSDDVYLNPIAGAKVYILGLENQAVFTDAQGNFSFSAVPSGDIKLAVDGRTATNAPVGFYFPEMVMDLQIEVGQANTAMGTMGTRDEKAANLTRPEVYLPRLQTSILQTVSNTQTTMVGVDATAAPNLTDQQRQFLTLEVQPGSLVGSDGQLLTNGQVGISTVPPELVRDMLPPGLLQHTFDITIQAPGVVAFNTPLQISFPNVFNAAPGTTLSLLSFDHTTGRLVIDGTATVSADGLSVTTDPGTGITKPGWHGPTAAGEQHVENIDRAFSDAINQTSALVLSGISALLGTVDLVPWDSIPGIGWIADSSIGLASVITGALADELASGEVSEGTQKQIALALASLGTGWVPGVGWLPSTTADIESWEIGINSFRNQYHATENAVGTLIGQIENWLLLKSLGPLVVPFSLELESQDIISRFSSTISSLEARVTNTIAMKNAIVAIGNIVGSNQSGPISDPLSMQTLRDATSALSSGTEFFNGIGVASPRQSTELLRPAVQNDKNEVISQLRSVSGPAEGVHYNISLGGGINIKGVTDRSGSWSVFLRENRSYSVSYFDSVTGAAWTEQVNTGRSGSQTRSQRISFSQGGPDVDGDGITDIGEAAIGTSPRVVDSDGDGLSDLAEVKAGLDPLSGRVITVGLVSSLPLSGVSKEIVLEGSLLSDDQQTAFVATGSYGLAIIDASQFQKPVILSQLDLSGDATDVSVDSRLGIAVVASNIGGLHFVNVSNPTAPSLIRTIATTPNQVEVSDGFAYVTVGGELRSYNVLTGELVQAVSLTAGLISGLAREGNILYTTDSANVLRATSASVGALITRGSLTLPLNSTQPASKVFVGNGIAYVGSTNPRNEGFVTVNVSDPDSLALISGVDAPNIIGQALAANGSGLLITAGNIITQTQSINALDVVDVSDPTNTGGFLTRLLLPATPFSVAIGAGIAFVADGTGGLQVVNYRAFDNLGQAPTVALTSPLIDLDPVTPGIQVTEGTTIPLQVTANDDVQVRNVETLVNGVVVSNDVSFPFELSALAFGSTTSTTTTTVQVRATDTGGNVGLSNTLTFQLVPDTFPPTLVSSNVTNGAIKDKTFRTIQLQFSEPLDSAKVTAQNFQLLNQASVAEAPTAIQLLSGGSVVQLTYNPLDLGTNKLVIKSANVTDKSGNAFGSQDLVIPFEIFSNVVPTLNPLPAIGSRVYVQTVSGTINAPLGSESFTISLDAGQTVTMGISPDSASLRPRVELVDGNGTVLGSAESLGIGEGVTLQAVPVPTTGIYTLRVQSISGTGPFRGVVYLNALQENEFFGGPKNDTLATAMNLSPSSLPLQGTADRMAVVGVADGGNDFYRLDLTQNQVMFAVVQALGGGNIGLELRDSAGTLLTIGQDVVPGFSKGIVAFQAPTTGTYYLNVIGSPDPDPIVGIPEYSLVVTRGAALEYLSNDSLNSAQGIPLSGQALGSVGTRVLPQVNLTIQDPIDYYYVLANAGDVLQIKTTTPGDGVGEPTNTLDPALQLFDPSGNLVVSNDNGAADGRNALITATAATTGLYKIAVLPTSGAGDYIVRVTGATGQATFNFQVDSSALRTNASQATAILHFTIPPLLSSVAPSDVTINGIAASSFDVVDNQTLRFNVSGVTPVGGGYTVSLPTGMIQDFHGDSNPAFSRLFTGDTVAPTVTASSINALSVIQPNPPGTFTPLSVTFTFSEPIDQSTLSNDDVQLRFGIAGQGFDSNPFNAGSVSYNTTLNQLTAVFNTGLPDSELMTLTLVGGSTGIHDLAGNPLNGSPNFPLPSGQGNPASDNYVVEFGVGPATPSFTPFDGDPPIGSLLYFPQHDIISTFSTPGETDVWTVDFQAGQTMGIGLTPTNGIQGKLTIVDPNGVTLGTISSSIAGKSVAIPDIPITASGNYRVEVTSLAGIGVYSVGFGLNSAFDVEDPILATGTNNTIATAQSLAVSAVPLQGTAVRLASQGAITSSFDADLYSFQGTVGQAGSLVLRQFSFTATPIVQLLKADGTLLATGSPAMDGTVRIDDVILPQTGIYFVRIASPGESFDYDLIVTQGASFEQAGTPAVAQDLTFSGQVLGGLEQQGQGANGAIRVAVLGGAGAVALVAQLNDDTFYDFEAVAVTNTDIDTFQKLSNYDVVVIGDPASRAQLAPIESTLTGWWFSRGGGLVGTGGLVTAAGPTGGGTLFNLDNVIPINLNAVSTQTTNPTLTITSALHEASQELATFTVAGKVELPAGAIDQNAVLLGTVNGTPAVVALDQWNSGAGPRSAYLAPMYFDTTATGLRSGSADRLLEQTIAWSSHVDILDRYLVNANAGDQLVVKTTTPLDGPHLPQNLLDPRLELLNSAGTIVASNDNGALDGKNALINYTVPVGAGGSYTIRVRGLQSGEYTLSVSGATGAPLMSSAGVASTSLTTTAGDAGLSSGLAYAQASWVSNFVTSGATASTQAQDDELLIALPG